MFTRDISMTKIYLIVALLAIVTRLIFVFLFPGSGGDWDIYSTVAENILNGCGVSLSDPESATCVPHFGGNQLPGYPAFIALVWEVFDHKDAAIRLAQTFIYVASLLWLVRSVYIYTLSTRIALLVGFVMAISPLQIAWPRFTQTETLALAATILVLAELLYSLAYKRLRIFSLAVALSFAMFIRLDSVLLTIPTAVTGFIIYKPYKAFKKGLVLLLLLLIPIGSWTVRNINVELPSLFPQNMTLPEGAHQPTGYLKWGWTWITEEYQRPGWGWGVNRFNYDSISIDDKAYDSIEEKSRVEGLLEDLKKYNGQPFPQEIDHKFSEIASERLRNYKFRTLIVNPLKRSAALWTNLFSSYAWPNELPSKISHQARLQAKRDGGIIDLALEYPFIAITKGITGGYKMLLQILFILITILAINRSITSKKIRNILFISGSIMLARTVFFAITNNIETRYSVEAVPGMELLVIYGIVYFFKTYREKT
jgi:4-amino-4-deoxy-L-arabinose transferase-like glycosyltransferase